MLWFYAAGLLMGGSSSTGPSVPPPVVYGFRNIPYTQSETTDVPYTQSKSLNIPYTQSETTDVP